MARKKTLPPLRYPIKRSFKMSEETFAELNKVAEAQNTKYGTLIRTIVEQWLLERTRNVHPKSKA